MCVCYAIDRVPATDGVCSDEPNQRSVFLFSFFFFFWFVLFFLYANSIGIQFLNCLSRIFSRTPEDDTKIPPATNQILFSILGRTLTRSGGSHWNLQATEMFSYLRLGYSARLTPPRLKAKTKKTKIISCDYQRFTDEILRGMDGWIALRAGCESDNRFVFLPPILRLDKSMSMMDSPFGLLPRHTFIHAKVFFLFLFVFLSVRNRNPPV